MLSIENDGRWISYNKRPNSKFNHSLENKFTVRCVNRIPIGFDQDIRAKLNKELFKTFSMIERFSNVKRSVLCKEL